MDLIDTIPDEGDLVEKKVTNSIAEENTWTIINNYLLSASDQKRKVFEDIIAGRPQRDTAAALGVHESRVSQIKAKLIKDLSALVLADELSV